MKHALLRFLHLFMAVVVLLSSMGFGLVEHSCQLRGKRVYSIHDTKPGCKRCQVRSHAPDQTPTVNRTDCCKDETRFAKVDITSSLSHQLVKFVNVISDRFGAGPSAVLLTLLNGPFDQHTNVAVAEYASPPPLSGRLLLTFVQSFLI
ncbi:HYC_CC_PP family protein [Fibrella arboris]|uniref:HYC_CC_PP family protein n=1 Tax=Fibrella arboris TaxID=3242486 RepID=UPI0035215FCC